jgi:xanthine dehydrogenase accessory factor
MRDLLRQLLAAIHAGRPVAWCRLVETRGSTPQKAGAAMLVYQDGSQAGTLGGGCVEAEVKRRALALVAENRPDICTFQLDSDYGWDDGLICGGRMDVAVMPVTPRAALAPIEEALARARSRRPAVLPVRVEREGQAVEYRINLEVPPTLLIAGAGHVGQAVARLAAGLDFHVVVFDDRRDYASRERFGEGARLVVDDIATALRAYPIDADCFVVIVTRGHAHDHQALDAVIRSPAAYVGLIGSKRKARLIFKDLLAAGISQELLDRVHTPIGLPIGAVTVPEIAVSIVAQLVEQRRKNAPALVEGPF